MTRPRDKPLDLEALEGEGARIAQAQAQASDAMIALLRQETDQTRQIAAAVAILSGYVKASAAMMDNADPKTLIFVCEQFTPEGPVREAIMAGIYARLESPGPRLPTH